MSAESHRVAERKRRAQSAAHEARKRAARDRTRRPVDPYNRSAERRAWVAQ